MSKKNSEKNYLLVVNPKSGKGIPIKKVDLIKAFLDCNKVKHTVSFTKKRGDAKNIAHDAIENGFSHIISVGGDGTSSEVVNGIIGSSLVFGVIPYGSGNDFPKALKVPLDFKSALKNIVFGNVVKVDLGKLEDKYFVNGLGIGFDGAVAARFKDYKKFGAFAGYLMGALVESIGFSSFSCSLKANSENSNGKYVMLGASNGPYQGGKFKLAPMASVNDGKLDFHIIQDMNPVRRILTVSKALNGSHIGVKEVNIFSGKELYIEIQRDLPAHMDGESMNLPAGKYKISVVEDAINVISSGLNNKV